MPDEIMTVEELAQYLKLDPQTVYRKFRSGEIPGVKIGRAVRFKREMVDRWLRAKAARQTPEEREAFRKRMQEWARERGITEEDVLEAVRAVRYGER